MKRKLKSLLALALCAVGLSAFAKEPDAVQLWEGGPYFATCNVGADTPEEAGYYFWWGDTVGYKRNGSNDGWVSVADDTSSIKFSETDPTAANTMKTTNEELKQKGWIDDSDNLVVSDDPATNHDAARAHLGAPWRMMTKADLDSLVANCDVEWTNNWNNTNIKGKIVKGRGDYSANSIFLPAAGFGNSSALAFDGTDGYYWSSTPISTAYNNANYLHIKESEFKATSGPRYPGYSVRAVRDTPPVTGPTVKVDSVTAGEPWSTITVNYTLGGVDAATDYKVAFDITAGGQIASVTNDAVKLTDGAATKEINTVEIFGKEVVDTKAKVKVSLIALCAVGLSAFAEEPDEEVVATAEATFVLGPALAVANVTTVTHWPWNGKIDVTCDLTGMGKVQLSAALTTNGVTVCTAKAENVTGETEIDLDQVGGVTNGVKFVWDAKADCPADFNSTDTKVKVTAKKVKPLGGVQLWKDGPYFAECNVGAEKPEEYGILTNFNDAAQAVTEALGGDWRLPTEAEWNALLTNCGKGTWTEQNGVKGRLFMGTGDYESNSIFLPAAGFDYSSGRAFAGDRGSFWSSEAFDDDSAWYLYFDVDDASVNCRGRSFGLSIRAVRNAK